MAKPTSPLSSFTFTQTHFDRFAQMRLENIRFRATHATLPVPPSTNLNRCTVLSKRLETISPSDLSFFQKELQSTQVKRFLEEFSRKIAGNRFEDIPSLLTILEVCHTLWHMYGNDFTASFSPMIVARYKRESANFNLYVFTLMLFLVAFDDAYETIFWPVVKDGIFLYSNIKNAKALDRLTDIRLPEMIFFLKFAGSALTTFPGAVPSLQASLDALAVDAPDIAKRLTMVISEKTKEGFVTLFNRYFNDIVKPTFKQANSNEMVANMKEFSSLMGVHSSTVFVEDKKEAAREEENVLFLYGSSEQKTFYTSFPAFGDISPCFLYKREPHRVEANFNRFMLGVKRLFDDHDTNVMAEEFIRNYQQYVAHELTPARFIQGILPRIGNTGIIRNIARFLFMIDTKELSLATVLVSLLKKQRNNLRFVTYIVLLVSELFKFSRNPQHIIATYRYLTDKTCSFNIAKRLQLILSSMQTCCHFIVTFVPFLQQTHMQEAFQIMAKRARPSEMTQASRYVHKIVFLFSVKTNTTVVYKSPQELFLESLLLNKTDLTTDQIVVLLRKFDYQDEETPTLLVHTLLNAMTLVSLFNLGDIVRITALLGQHQPRVLTSFVDTLVELTFYGFECPAKLLKHHRLLYAKAFAELFLQRCINEAFLTTFLDFVYRLTLRYEKQPDTSRKFYRSVYSMKYFGIRIIVEILDICCEHFSKKAQVWLIKFILRLQLLMFESVVSADLELVMRRMLQKVNLPRFRTRLEFTHLVRLQRTIENKQYSVEALRTLITRTVSSINVEWDERGATKVETLRQQEEAELERRRKEEERREEEEKAKRAKEERMARRVDEAEFEQELEENIAEIEQKTDRKCVDLMESSIMLDTRDVAIPENSALNMLVSDGEKTKRVIRVGRPDEQTEEKKTPKAKPKKARVTYVV